MTRTELIIQLLKVAIGLALGAYFVWWSLEVLDRLTPEGDAPATPPLALRKRPFQVRHQSTIDVGGRNAIGRDVDPPA